MALFYKYVNTSTHVKDKA